MLSVKQSHNQSSSREIEIYNTIHPVIFFADVWYWLTLYYIRTAGFMVNSGLTWSPLSNFCLSSKWHCHRRNHLATLRQMWPTLWPWEILPCTWSLLRLRTKAHWTANVSCRRLIQSEACLRDTLELAAGHWQNFTGKLLLHCHAHSVRSLKLLMCRRGQVTPRLG